MSVEDGIKRNQALLAYEPGKVRLFVPLKALKATHHLLRLAGRRESGVMWYGNKDGRGDGSVCYVVAPKQEMRWGNYRVSAEALAEAAHRVPEGCKPLAQVHSHPGKWVEHSTYDDEMVSSHRILSLVFPFYGRNSRGFLQGVGVHEWQNGYWHLLNSEMAKNRICPTDGEVCVEDLR